MQWFSGLYSGGVIASGATDFTTLTNVVALIGYAGSANVQLAHNDGSGNAVLLDLGANFPARTVGATYRLRLAITKGGTTLYYRVERLDTATTPVTGSFTTEIPAASTFLYPLHTCRNASDAVAVAIDSVGFDAWILD
jgi:hypothetical protein